MCYSKTILKEQILSTNVPEENYMVNVLVTAFPKPLQERFRQQMQHHTLKREIIATRLSNIIVNEMGFTYVYRLQIETGAPISAIVRAYMITRSVLNLESIWKQIEELGNKISSQTQMDMMMIYVRLSRRVARWFLRTQRRALDITDTIKLYSEGVAELKKCMPNVFGESFRAQYDEQYQERIAEGIPAELAHELTVTRGLFAAADIIEIAHERKVNIAKVAEIYFGIGEYLDIGWLRTQVIIHPTENHWESLSREALRDDLDWQQRQLTDAIMGFDTNNHDLQSRLEYWGKVHKELIERWHLIIKELKSTVSLNYTMYLVATRELLDLTQTTLQSNLKMDEVS
jgi:glutamate dehydrogenase